MRIPKEFKKGDCFISVSYYITGGLLMFTGEKEEHIQTIEILEVSPSKKYIRVLIDDQQDISNPSACWVSVKELKSLYFHGKWEKIK